MKTEATATARTATARVLPQPQDALPVRNGPLLYYVYGFADSSTGRPSRPRQPWPPRPVHSLEPDRDCEWIVAGGLAALVSAVPAEDYEEKPLGEHMENHAWLAERVGRHNCVLLEVMPQLPVVPCRFGTLLRQREGVTGLLHRLRGPLRKALKRLCGCAEWAVKVRVAAPIHPLEEAGREPSDGDGAGRAWMVRRSKERDARRTAEARARTRANPILTRLCLWSRDAAPLPLRNLGQQGELILNLACLVRTADTCRWLSRVQTLAAAEKKNHVALTWTGPWPAYSFVDGVATTARA